MQRSRRSIIYRLTGANFRHPRYLKRLLAIRRIYAGIVSLSKMAKHVPGENEQIELLFCDAGSEFLGGNFPKCVLHGSGANESL